MDLNKLNSYALDQRAHIESAVFNRQYPSTTYQSIVPIDTSADKNADTIVKKMLDAKGLAKWAGSESTDTPMVDFAMNYITHDIFTLDIGFKLNRRELARSIQANTNVSTERAGALKDVFERQMNRIALFGDSEKQMEGFYNSSDVTKIIAAKSIQELIADISVTGGAQDAVNFFAQIINGIQEGTLGIYRPDTICLPLSDYNLLKATLLPAAGTSTLLPFLEANLSVTFVPDVYLSAGTMKNIQGQSYLAKDRMVFYKKDMELVKLHMPQVLEAFTPYTNDQKVWNFVFEARTGGVEWRVPASALYVELP